MNIDDCRFQEREGVAVDQQWMIFAGKRLENDRTIGYYSILDESTVHFILRSGRGEPEKEQEKEIEMGFGGTYHITYE